MSFTEEVMLGARDAILDLIKRLTKTFAENAALKAASDWVDYRSNVGNWTVKDFTKAMNGHVKEKFAKAASDDWESRNLRSCDIAWEDFLADQYAYAWEVPDNQALMIAERSAMKNAWDKTWSEVIQVCWYDLWCAAWKRVVDIMKKEVRDDYISGSSCLDVDRCRWLI
jgi:hypothetical protein